MDVLGVMKRLANKNYVSIIANDLSIMQRVKNEIRVLATLGCPIIVTQILLMTTGVLDTVMAGQSSTEDLAGVAIGANIMAPILLLSLGLIAGITTIVAQASGAKQYTLVISTVWQSAWIALFSSIITGVALLNIDPVIRFFDVNEAIRPVASGYLRAITYGVPAIYGYSVLRSYCDGLAFTGAAMVASMISLMVNASLNYILIYGKFGFTALGGIGCGWATTVSMWISFIIMLCYVTFSRNFRHIVLFSRVSGPNWPQIMEQLKLGLPVGLMLVTESIMFSIIALFLGVYGATVVAAHQIVLNVIFLALMVPVSVGLTMTIRVGFLLGAKQATTARISAMTGMMLSFIFSVVSGVGILSFTGSIVAVYTTDAAVQSLAVDILLFAVVFLLVDALQISSVGALRGYKDTKVPMFVVMTIFLGICLPLGYTLGMTSGAGQSWKAQGFWVGLIIGLFFASVLMAIRLHLVSCRMMQKDLENY